MMSYNYLFDPSQVGNMPRPTSEQLEREAIEWDNPFIPTGEDHYLYGNTAYMTELAYKGGEARKKIRKKWIFAKTILRHFRYEDYKKGLTKTSKSDIL
jgi:hypothetical protein